MKKLLLLALLPITAIAAPIKGISETYQDWDLVCDNTGTCRMVGYQSAELDKPTSILFTRKAGDSETVSAELSFYNFDENDKEIPIAKTTEIFLDGQSLGTVVNHNDSVSTLNQAQTVALLNALKKSSKIEIVSGQFKGEVSDKGAAAAMLKMDEFQQRLNKPSALIRKGENKAASLRPQPVPKIQAVKIPHRETYSIERGSAKFDEVMALLRQRNGTEESADNYCSALHDNEAFGSERITFYPLTNGKVLAETICWNGPYQSSNYYAVMDDKLTKVEQELAPLYQAAIYDEKAHFLTVDSSFKGRGIGDCYSGHEAVWNGKIFVRTLEWRTGSCKGFTGGGWTLPTFVSQVVAK